MPGESHEQRRLAGYTVHGVAESDTTSDSHFHFGGVARGYFFWASALRGNYECLVVPVPTPARHSIAVTRDFGSEFRTLLAPKIQALATASTRERLGKSSLCCSVLLQATVLPQPGTQGKRQDLCL